MIYVLHWKTVDIIIREELMYQIFVVEDELLIRQSIRNIIENMQGPYSLCGEASDGEMALSMMQDLMPDIVLTDIRMPFLDGFELIRHAKAMMPWLKIAIISGYGDFESAQKAISLGGGSIPAQAHPATGTDKSH